MSGETAWWTDRARPEVIAWLRECLEAPRIRSGTGRPPTWSVDQVATLCDGVHAGDSYWTIARSIGVTKNAVVGKVARLGALGLLTHQTSPVGRRSDPAPPVPTRILSGERTLPLLPSERASIGASP